jgi:LmbE family N-acetylglucosaminyl deacetylase
MNVLAVGAHPDDVEIGCFGTLMKHQSMGDKVIVAVTTSGGGGGRTWEKIERELTASMMVLKPYSFKVLDGPNGHLHINWHTVTLIDQLIKSYEIDTIYTHWYGDAHQDHQETFKIVMAACRHAAVGNIYLMETNRGPTVSQHIFNPRRFVSLGRFITDKLKAIQCYGSYFNNSDIHYYRKRAEMRGAQVDVPFAEAFEVIQEVDR